MKIAIFTDTYIPQINGVVTSTVLFAQAFRKMGHEVYILAPKVKGYIDSDPYVWRLRSFTFPFQPEYKIIVPYSRKLRQFKSLGIDVIHAQTPFSMGYLAQYLAWKNKIPLAHTYHTFFTEYLHYFPILPRKYLKKFAILESKRFCNRCKYIVVPTEKIKEKLIEFGVKVPLKVIPTGVTVPENLKNYNPREFRQEYQIPIDKNIVVFAGRLGKEKNVEFLLKSFRLVLDQVPNSFLFIAGDGPEKKNMQNIAAQLGLTNHILFSGYLQHEDIFKVFKAAKVFSFPSKTETQGLSVVESLSVGTPAVCIDALGVSDILKGNRGGFLTKDNVEDYAQKVVLLLTDPKVYAQKQQEALVRAEDYSINTLSEQMIAIYQQIIQS